jgi:hypothetical protein
MVRILPVGLLAVLVAAVVAGLVLWGPWPTLLYAGAFVLGLIVLVLRRRAP